MGFFCLCKPEYHRFIQQIYPPNTIGTETNLQCYKLNQFINYCVRHPNKVKEASKALTVQIEKDLRKGKRGYFLLGTEAFVKLIDACHDELYIFEDVIYDIIDSLFLHSEFNVLSEGVKIFLQYIRFQYHSETEKNKLTKYITVFTVLSTNDDASNKLQLRQTGLKCLNSLITALDNTVLEVHIEEIIDAVLDNLGQSLSDNELESSIRSFGLQCLTSIATIFSSVEITLLIDPLFYALDKISWSPINHATECMRTIILAKQNSLAQPLFVYLFKHIQALHQSLKLNNPAIVPISPHSQRINYKNSDIQVTEPMLINIFNVSIQVVKSFHSSTMPYIRDSFELIFNLYISLYIERKNKQIYEVIFNVMLRLYDKLASTAEKTDSVFLLLTLSINNTEHCKSLLHFTKSIVEKIRDPILFSDKFMNTIMSQYNGGAVELKIDLLSLLTHIIMTNLTSEKNASNTQNLKFSDIQLYQFYNLFVNKVTLTTLNDHLYDQLTTLFKALCLYDLYSVLPVALYMLLYIQWYTLYETSSGLSLQLDQITLLDKRLEFINSVPNNFPISLSPGLLLILHLFVSNCFYYIGKQIGHTFHIYILSVLKYRYSVHLNKYEPDAPTANTILFQKDPLCSSLYESYSKKSDDFVYRMNEVFDGFLEKIDENMTSHYSESIKSGALQTVKTGNDTAPSNDSSSVGMSDEDDSDGDEEDSTTNYELLKHKLAVKLQQRKLLLASCINTLSPNYLTKTVELNDSNQKYLNFMEM